MPRQQIDLDAGVAAILGESQQRQKCRSMTAKERYDAERVRVTYDCPRWLREAVKKKGKLLGTSASQFAVMLLAWAMGEYIDGNQELRELIYRSKDPRPDALKIEYDLGVPDKLHRTISNNGTD
jgi:hypothetical protein